MISEQCADASVVQTIRLTSFFLFLSLSLSHSLTISLSLSLSLSLSCDSSSHLFLLVREDYSEVLGSIEGILSRRGQNIHLRVPFQSENSRLDEK
jgi:hypothetical protein